jgi:hypothetical protein
MVWYALMLVHVWQHWTLTKALVKPKVINRNKITFMTLVVFLLMTFTVILFIFDVSEQTIRIHNVISGSVSKSLKFIIFAKKTDETLSHNNLSVLQLR